MHGHLWVFGIGHHHIGFMHSWLCKFSPPPCVHMRGGWLRRHSHGQTQLGGVTWRSARAVAAFRVPQSRHAITLIPLQSVYPVHAWLALCPGISPVHCSHGFEGPSRSVPLASSLLQSAPARLRISLSTHSHVPRSHDSGLAVCGPVSFRSRVLSCEGSVVLVGTYK